MRVLLVFSVVLAVALAQNPVLAPLTRLTEDQIRAEMTNKQGVRFRVNCLLQKRDCSTEDPLARPLAVLVQGWSESKTICGDCTQADARKARLMISILQQDYREEYNAVARAYGLV